MFRAKTVLVIGAGASVEVGLPMGDALLKQIADLVHYKFDLRKLMKGDPVILEALKRLPDECGIEDLNSYITAGRQLSKAAVQAMSVDYVIDALQDPLVELIGKLGIVRAILRAEGASEVFKTPLGEPHNLLLSSFDKTWYRRLTNLFVEGVKKCDVESIFSNIEIINFNYDRCLEHYLRTSLANAFAMKVDEFQEHMPSLIVHRPYGVAGRLPWQDGNGRGVEFGDSDPQHLYEIARQIRTFTEQMTDGQQLNAIKLAIANADRIVFLGFGFHRQNIELLAHPVQPHTQILATAFGISQSDKNVIAEELSTAFEIHDAIDIGRIALVDAPCERFFQDYWRTLTAERSYEEPIEVPHAALQPDFKIPTLPFRKQR